MDARMLEGMLLAALGQHVPADDRNAFEAKLSAVLRACRELSDTLTEIDEMEEKFRLKQAQKGDDADAG